MTLTKILRRLKLYALTLYRLFRDPRTPRISKGLLIVALAYIVLPFDFVPDFIPLAGLIDEALIIPFLIHFAVSFAPKELREEFQNKQSK